MQLITPQPPLLIGIERIGILVEQWHSHPAQLSDRYHCDIELLPTQRRQREQMATRVLLHTLLPHYNGSISYDNNGKPTLANGYQISVSHSNQWAAIALHPTQAVGIDIEELRPKIVRIADRFLSSSEIENLQNTIRSDHDRLLRYTVYWSAKEALFKWHSKGEVDFKKHLCIYAYNSGTGKIEAEVRKDESPVALTLHCLKLEEAVCVWIVPNDLDVDR